jgi:D-serine deaminase-like pyridoxal phosphate-dependent protein
MARIRSLHGVPMPVNRVYELASIKAECEKHNATLRVMIDHVAQVEALVKLGSKHTGSKKWSCYLKVDIETKRAGLPPQSADMNSLIEALLAAKDHIDIFGTCQSVP